MRTRPCEFAFPVVLLLWAVGIVAGVDHRVGHDLYTVVFLVAAGVSMGWYMYEEHKLRRR